VSIFSHFQILQQVKTCTWLLLHELLNKLQFSFYKSRTACSLAFNSIKSSLQTA
jgi:hypothetical protein